MTQQSINIGTNPNDGTGDPLRTAFSKCNSNFTDLYTTAYATNVVNSFNTRVGAVTLTSGDVTTALTYTPLNRAGDTATGTMIFNAGWLSGNTGTINLNPAIVSALPTPVTGTILRLINNDGTVTRILLDSYINAGNPAGVVTFRGARGIGSAPTAVQNTDVFGGISGHGYGATSFQTASTSAITFVAEENFSDTNQGSAIVFQVTPTGSITKAELLRLTSGGNLLVKSTTGSNASTTGALVVSGGLGVAGNINISNAGVLFANGGTRYNLVTVAVNTNLSVLNRYVNVSTSGTTMTLPAASGSGVQGLVLSIKNTAASGNVTVNTAGGNIDGVSTLTITGTMAKATFVSDGTNWFTY